MKLSFAVAALGLALSAPPALAGLTYAGEAQTAPAGGQVVNDSDLAWRVTVPEGWAWRPAKSAGGFTVLLMYTLGQSDDEVLGNAPAKSGGAVCSTLYTLERDTAGLDQATLNAEADTVAKDAILALVNQPDSPAKGVSFVESRNIKGITVTAMLLPMTGEANAVAGSATMRTPGHSHAINCTATLGGPDVATPIKALFKSFEPL